MVKIDGVGGYSPTRVRKKDSVKGKSSDTFDVKQTPLDAGVTRTSPVKSAEEIASVTQLMSLQEITASDPNKKKIVKNGESILDSLEQLQTQILSGTISKSALTQIISMTNSTPQIMDPHLKQIIAEIRQRAMIEIAKIEMSSGDIYA